MRSTGKWMDLETESHTMGYLETGRQGSHVVYDWGVCVIFAVPIEVMKLVRGYAGPSQESGE